MSAPKRRPGFDLRELIVGSLCAIVCVVSVWVVIVNQQTVGWPHLLAMLGGLAGLSVMLALYNRKYR